MTTPDQTLTINDLHALRSIIEVASTRNAFKPAEFSAVGATYDKLSAFINAVTPPAAPTAETATQEEGTE